VPPSGYFFDHILGIKPAFAGNGASHSARALHVDFAVKVDEPRYVIVLEKASSKEDALARAARLRKTVPNAQAIQTGAGYYVIQPGAKTEVEATREALKLKKQLLSPSLLRVPNTTN
jgi:hypothetical protein